MPSVSIVIITYKRHREVLDAIKSIQDDAGYEEIVIIDNDPKSDLQKKLPPNLSIRYYLQDENWGVAGGRNKGIEASRGDILLFLDDDAVFASENVLATVHDYFESDPLLACLTFKTNIWLYDEFNISLFETLSQLLPLLPGKHDTKVGYRNVMTVNWISRYRFLIRRDRMLMNYELMTIKVKIYPCIR